MWTQQSERCVCCSADSGAHGRHTGLSEKYTHVYICRRATGPLSWPAAEALGLYRGAPQPAEGIPPAFRLAVAAVLLSLRRASPRGPGQPHRPPCGGLLRRPLKITLSTAALLSLRSEHGEARRQKNMPDSHASLSLCFCLCVSVSVSFSICVSVSRFVRLSASRSREKSTPGKQVSRY